MRRAAKLLNVFLLAAGLSAGAGAHASAAAEPPSPRILHLDVAALEVSFAATDLRGLARGQTLIVVIREAGAFRYLIDAVTPAGAVTEISGHLVGDPARRLALGVIEEGVSGLIDTPQQLYALGYANRVQYFSPADADPLAGRLDGQPLAIRAGTPGRGEDPPVPGARPDDVDLPLLASLHSGDEVIMQLPNLGSTRIVYLETRAGPSATWVGYLKDFGPTYPVLITYSPAALEGHIQTPAGEVHLTTGAQGDTYLYNPTALGYRSALGEGDACAVPITVRATTGTDATPAAEGGVAMAASGAGQEIDVLVYYTPGMVSKYGSAGAVATRVDALIALANQAYAAGGLSHRLRRVGLEPISLTDNTANSTLLDQMRTRSGAFSVLDSRRNQLGADMVSVLRPFIRDSQVSCGVAYVGGYNVQNIGSYGEYMLSVVSDGVDQGGSPAYCVNTSFAHELGHNMGLMHDRATVASQGGGVGVRPYAYGYASGGVWGTIMSYTFPHQVKFSNPLDYTCNGNQRCGLPAGDPNSADNVGALTETMPVVSGFRASAGGGGSHAISGVISLDGKAAAGIGLAVNVTAGDAGQVTCTASGSGGVYSCTAPAGTSLVLTPSYSPPANTAVTWSPASASFSNLAASQTANFSGVTRSTITSHTVSGTIRLNGQARAGVSFKVTAPTGYSPSAVRCTASAADGSYSCQAPPGHTFTLAPNNPSPLPTGAKLTWSPAQTTFTKITGNRTAGFSATMTVPNFTVSGSLKVNGSARSGVGMRVTAPEGFDAARVRCSVTASAGTYSCQAPSGHAFTLTPTLSGVPTGGTLSWSPVQASYSNLNANKTGNFSGTLRVPPVTLSGTVSLRANGVSSARPALKVTAPTGYSASAVRCGSIAGDGSYSCEVPYEHSFTLAPSLSGMPTGAKVTWSPSQFSFSKVTTDRTAGFTANLTLPTLTVSGGIKVNGQARSGVSLQVSAPEGFDAGKVRCTVTASSGTYSCQVPYGHSFTLTPTLSGVPTGGTVSWSPGQATYSNVTSNRTGNFYATLNVPPVNLSGTARVNGSPASGISFRITAPTGFSTSQVRCSVDSAAGTYACQAPYGHSFTLAPALSGVPAGARVSWSPSQTSFNNVTTDRSANFSASLTR